MLARVYQGESEIHEYWISEKLDGVRGYWDGSSLRTRGGSTISAPHWYTENWPSFAMDGELWIDHLSFDRVSGIVRSESADDESWKQVRFMVFDLPQHSGSFTQRLEFMHGHLPPRNIPWLQVVPQFRVASAEALEQALAEITAAGGEGLMLHHQDALYVEGRSNGILKYKDHEDAEARIIGYTAGQGKYQGMVGALIVEDETGRRFRLGSGLSDADRANPPPVGSWVTYRYNGLTSRGLPRFARYLRIRHDYIPAGE